MKLRDKIRASNGAGFEGKIIEAPKPPKKWVILFTNGKQKTVTKSFLKKYYEVIHE